VSKKQKINTRSSTKSEIVGVDNISPQMLWMRYFIEAQWYNVEESIINQYNLSAMTLETNGNVSISKRSKHIRVPYYLIKDRIASGDVTLRHCPAEVMLAGHFTKPLQGRNLSWQIRDEMQGIPANAPAISLSWDQDQVGIKNDGANLAGPSSH
jgi:hypothetical protein